MGAARLEVLFAFTFAFALGVGSFVPVVFAAETEAPLERAVLALFVNDVAHGEIPVILRGTDVLVMDGELERAGLTGFAGSVEQLKGKSYVPIGSIRPALEFKVDTDALELRLKTPVALLERTSVNFRAVAPASFEQRNDTSAFLNYSAHYTGGLPLLFGEAGLSVQGALLTTSVAMTANNHVVRGLSSLTIDQHAGLRRWTLGDSVVNAGPLGGSGTIGGLTLSKTFSIDPYFMTIPGLGMSGAALTPSTLEVYVNGVLVRRQAIAPGPFRLDNLPLQDGASNAKYVVRDAFGHEMTASSQFYSSSTLLAAGLSDYTYAIGAARNNLSTESFDYSHLGALIRQRYGLTSHITIGGRVEVGPAVLSFGPLVSVLLPFGQIDLESGASFAEGGRGTALSGAYSYSSQPFSASVGIELDTDKYATLSLKPTDNRQTLAVGASTSVPVAHWATFGAQYRYLLDRDHGPSGSIAVTVGAPLTKWLAFSGNVSRLVQASGSTLSANATLVASLDHGITASLSETHQGGKEEVSAGLNRGTPIGTGYGYHMQATASETPHVEVQGQAQWAHGRYLAELDFNRQGGAVTAEAAGAVVFVPSVGVFFTQPVDQGFAVVHLPKTQGVRVLLNNQAIDRTDTAGNVFLPGLLPYYANRVGVNDTDLPLDYLVEITEKSIAPPLRGAAVVEFPAKRSTFLRGRMHASRGTDNAAAFGELHIPVAGKDVVAPLGRDGEFDVEDVPVGTYEATVLYGTGKGGCSVAVVVPASNSFVTKLGTLTCTP